MIKAVLLDLDDTLLRTNTDAFVQRYVRLLIEKAASVFTSHNPDQLSRALRQAVGLVLQNTDPTTSNVQLATNYFSEQTGITAQEWITFQQKFHQDAYLSLGALVSPIPTARVLVERLQAMGLAVIVATNPIFLQAAIMQRLRWGNLVDLPFALITHAENMHFTKPNPHYYEEILARVGVEADEAIMVGDNVASDIVPARAAGLNTFWINEWSAPTTDPVQADGHGTLAAFEQLVAAGGLSRLQPLPHTPEQVIPRMVGNIGALHGLVDTIKPEYWHMRPDPNEWSPLEIVVHLRDSERLVQRPRLQRIATEENPFISPPKTPPAPGESDLSHEEGAQALAQLWEERCQTITYLSELDTAAWARPARHSIFGPTTLLEMAHFTTRHDHLHINQLCQTVGRCAQQ
ncbi:MAG: HAD-IA family hydrolase [Anaerolineae bacterium]|nr:HAD-IA family hydrolase [Anaerolineae bacterium]